MTMTAITKVKFIVLYRAAECNSDFTPDYNNPDGIETSWEKFEESDEYWDAMSEVREGEVETNLSCDYSRNYESKAVAARLPDGSWVGWTYWYGGGKHSSPSSIDWINHAYDVSCIEEEKLVIVRTFGKIE